MKWLGGLLLALSGTCAFAQASAPAPSTAQGEPRSGVQLRDRDFGVTTRQFGLDRRVEMYQWREGGNGYGRVWNAAPIDSSGFAPGHENPPALPIGSERWWATDATIDGAPLDESVLKTLGRWRDFRPGFSRLPANLAATFQPEGDGLGSAENPMDPQIGDLRIRWRELVLPPLAGELVLKDGRWRLRSEHARPSETPAGIAQPDDESARHEPAGPLWPWLLAALLPVLVAVALRRRRKAPGYILSPTKKTGLPRS